MAGYAQGTAEGGAPVPQEAKLLTVSQALDIVKGALKGIRLTIVGEVSEVSAKRSYKAVYFTIKDRDSSLKCLMWNDLYRASGMELEIGQKVEVSGFFSLYAARGTMNFDVRRLSFAGEGRLRMEVARLARKLEAEGLTDPARKRPLPEYPSVIGLVTSPHSDAVHDILRTLRRRWPLARVVLAGVPVEGAGAPAAMIEGLRCVAESDAEFVLLGRGGGSYESMMPFNDEGLARAIAACPIPVVTGIGHEPDNFIADIVADVRLSTPTMAAAGVVPDQAEVAEALATRGKALHGRMLRALERKSSEVKRLSDRPVLRDATQLFAQEAMGVDHLAGRLERALPAGLEKRRDTVAQLRGRMARVAAIGFQRERSLVDRHRARLTVGLSGATDRFRRDMGLRAARLNDLSPLAVLGRGYAIARSESGDVVKSVSSVSSGDRLQVQVSDGFIDAKVGGSRLVSTETVALDD